MFAPSRHMLESTSTPCVASTSGRGARAVRRHARSLRSAVTPRAQGVATEKKVATPPPAITLTDNALVHLQKLRDESGGANILLRMGVKSGGCSGMSYNMDFETDDNIRPDDAVMSYEGGFRLVCDPKSLLYLFGLRLDYSSALVGGGFQFHNPNAESSCGCGKSFGL